MAKIILDEDVHQYTVDGEEVPSVSELTRFISKEIYGDVVQSTLDAAADRGTRVHKGAEALDKFGTVEIEDELLPYLQAYVSFIKEHKPEWEKIEWPVNNGMLYAGTIDRYGILDTKRSIVDIKTTSRIGPAHRVLYTAAQNLYRMAIEGDHPVEQIVILQLKKDGTYKCIELEIQDELANACIALSQALRKRRRSGAND